MAKKRAQAAVELLTTYGWAIIAVLLVIGTLAYFDIFDAKRFVSERCDTGQQIQCTGAYINNRGYFEMEIKNNYLISVDIESVSVGFNGLEFNLIDLEDYTEYKTLDPGASSRFYINSDSLGNLHRGDKDEVDVQLTFRRHADPYTPGSCGITGTTCYNISGDVVIKVQDAERVPPPHVGTEYPNP